MALPLALSFPLSFIFVKNEFELADVHTPYSFRIIDPPNLPEQSIAYSHFPFLTMCVSSSPKHLHSVPSSVNPSSTLQTTQTPSTRVASGFSHTHVFVSSSNVKPSLHTHSPSSFILSVDVEY